MIHMPSLMDDAKGVATVRDLRWPDGVTCPHGESPEITKQGHDDTQPERQPYGCQSCERRFDALTDTIFAGHHQPLGLWRRCLYLMGLHLSNAQMAQELDLNKEAVHHMTTQLRQGIVTQKTAPILSGEAECDEVYIVAGHQGPPHEGAKQGASADGGDARVAGDAGGSTARNQRSSACSNGAVKS